MPIIIRQRDIIGSTLTRGVSDRRYDRATRTALVDNLANPNVNNTDLDQAIQRLIDDVGLFHPQQPTLPLIRVTAKKWGLKKAYVYLEYGRRSFSVPTSPAMSLIRYRSGTVATQWYRRTIFSSGLAAIGPLTDAITGEQIGTGLPHGMLQFLDSRANNDPAAVPVHWPWIRAALRFEVPTVLAANPLPSVLGLLNRINSGNITFDNVTYPAFTVRFDSIEVDVVQASTLQYRTNYVFTAVPYGWWNQIVVGPTNNNFNVWITRNGLAYLTGNFVNAFPVHA